jgi:uncharacterized C2H2 Zn-finger protein
MEGPVVTLSAFDFDAAVFKSFKLYVKHYAKDFSWFKSNKPDPSECEHYFNVYYKGDDFASLCPGVEDTKANRAKIAFIYYEDGDKFFKFCYRKDVVLGDRARSTTVNLM